MENCDQWSHDTMRTMVMRKTDDVLADLKRVGAVGAPPPPPVPLVVEVEKGVPESIKPLDAGVVESVEAVDAAIAGLDDAVRGLEAAREALVHLRRALRPAENVAEEAPEAPLSAPKVPEAHPAAQEPQRPPEPSQGPQEVDEETLARAREAARRKILGEDIPPEQRAALDEEDDVPYVGQVRALPLDAQPEEITIGTVGTIKPSFPAEE